MKPLIAALLSLTICATLTGEAVPDWEAPLAKGAETNLVSLNLAAGNQQAADYLKRDARPAMTELEPFVPDGLKPKAPDVDGLFMVRAYGLPPDMLGSGPFCLLKRKGTYHLLTATNFARLFGPVKEKEEVLPLVTFYERLFGNPFAGVITAVRPKNEKDPPPDVTKITATKKGFAVKLILINRVRHAYFAEKHLLVHPDGIIEVTKPPKIIKDLGKGIVF